MWRVGGVALPLVLAGAPLFGQAGEPLYSQYRDAVLAYQRGDFDAAAGVLTRWSDDELRRVVRFAVGQPTGIASGSVSSLPGFAGEPPDGRLFEAGAMLHAEMVGRQGLDRRTAAEHLELGEMLVRGIDRTRPAAPQADREGALAFQQRWYVLVASVYLASTDPQAAEPWLARGAALAQGRPRQAGAQAWIDLTSGIAFEMKAHLLDPECRRPSCETGNWQSQMPSQLTFAQDAYLRALERDPSLVEARLRLGRVRFLLNHRDQARAELQRALAEATSTRHRYLGHLFLGELEQVEKNWSRALDEYHEARTVGPQFQSSYIAIGFLAQLHGDHAALEGMAAAAARPAGDERDPWWSYQNGGVDEVTLGWLRQQVARSP